jgi:LacI family transcriptional regulator
MMTDSNLTSGSEKPNSSASIQPIVGFIVTEYNFCVYYAQMVAAFSQYMQKAGMVVEMAYHNDQFENLRKIVDEMLERNVRTFLINPLLSEDIRPILDDLHARGAVVQLMGRWIDYPDCDFIGTDNRQIGYLATRHLIELGHTRIVYVGAASNPTSYDRASGYVNAMNEARLSPRIFHMHSYPHLPISPDFLPYLNPENTPAALWREMVRRQVTAVFCYNYDDADWVHQEIRKFNLFVPRDISIIAVDNPPAARYMGHLLTTFLQPGEEMGRIATDLLLRRLAGENFPPQKILLPGQLVLHSSTSAPRDWRVAHG